MENNLILVICMYAALGLVGLGILAIALFSARNLAYGKVEPIKIVTMAIPVVVLVALGFIMPTWAQAGILTLIIMMGLALLALLYTGVRGAFK